MCVSTFPPAYEPVVCQHVQQCEEKDTLAMPSRIFFLFMVLVVTIWTHREGLQTRNKRKKLHIRHYPEFGMNLFSIGFLL